MYFLTTIRNTFQSNSIKDNTISVTCFHDGGGDTLAYFTPEEDNLGYMSR